MAESALGGDSEKVEEQVMEVHPSKDDSAEEDDADVGVESDADSLESASVDGGDPDR
jgi:hypothetical protein